MFLVINADDLGLHPAVQRAVEAGAADGVITSASVLANGRYLRDVLSVEGVGLGAHLNLLRGRPLSPVDEIPSLVEAKGLFVGDYRKLLLRRLAGRLDMKQVELEWGRQIEKLLDLGLTLTHLDSEKHIHVWPGLMEIAGRLARRFGVRWVRRPVEPTAWTRWDGGGVRCKLLAHWCAQTRLPGDVGAPDLVWGIADQGARLSAERFGAFLGGRPEGVRVVEIACHPGCPGAQDPALPSEFGPMRVEGMWEAELKSLLSPQWRDLIAKNGITLTHYGKLDPGNLDESAA